MRSDRNAPVFSFLKVPSFIKLLDTLRNNTVVEVRKLFRYEDHFEIS